MATINMIHGDSLQAMKDMPDKAYNLAIVDVPYGIGESKNKRGGTKFGKSATISKNYGSKTWDNKAPDERYFTELQRVSVNQIIWGGQSFYQQNSKSCQSKKCSYIRKQSSFVG